MGKKIKYPSGAIKRADRKIKKLLQDIIRKKRGGTTTKGKKTAPRRLNKRSGNLYKNVKPIIKAKGNGELEFDIQVMEYYQYLDEGTKRIKHPWFLTEELMDEKEFLEALSELLALGFENFAVDILSELEDD